MSTQLVTTRRNITLKDVAEAAGVSPMSVSAVLNGGGRGTRYVSQEARARILKAADDLGYQRNELARAVATGSSYVLGVVVCRPQSMTVSYMLMGALDEAQRNGYAVKVLRYASGSKEHFQEMRRIMGQCVAWRVDGVIALNAYEEDLRAIEFQQNLPFVLLDAHPDVGRDVSICADDEQGLRDVVQHLYDLGHRDMAFLSGGQGEGPHTIGATRVKIFEKTMASLGLDVPPHRIFYEVWSAYHAERGVHTLMDATQKKPTAILCAGDDPLAMVALRTLRQRGLRVPQDVSVTGFGDLPMAQLADPPLTTVAQPFEEMGRRAVRELLLRMGKNTENALALEERVQLESGALAVPTRLVKRSSTAPPP
jgi:DNA-binding LacI/PurR family transcriptional regulator